MVQTVSPTLSVVAASQRELVDQLNDAGPDIYYNPDFRRVLEVHIPAFLARSLSYPITIDQQVAAVYAYDIYGLLTYYSVPRWLQWITMRVNGYTSPDQYTPDKLSLIFPDNTMIEQIQEAEQTLLAIV